VTFYSLLTVDNAQSHVTAFRPISEAARSWSDDKVKLLLDSEADVMHREIRVPHLCMQLLRMDM